MAKIDPGVKDEGTDSSKNAAADGTDAMEKMMQSIRETAIMQMKFQSEMGVIQLVVKMNEAVAKMLKAAGEAIKNLA